MAAKKAAAKKSSPVTKGVKNTANTQAAVARQLSIEKGAGVVSSKPAAATTSSGSRSLPSSPTVSGAQPSGHTGETLSIKKVGDAYQIIGNSSGKVYDSKPDVSSALSRQTELNSGAKPDATGAFTTGSQATDTYLQATEQNVQEKEAAAVAQGLTVTPEMRAAWLQQAHDELSPYYTEVIKNAELDLGTSLGRLVQDTRASEAAYAKQYGQALEANTGNLQDRGMLYGGVRNESERRLAEAANADLTALDTQFSRGLQDTSTTAARSLGTSTVDSYGKGLGSTSSVGRVLAGSPVFQPGSSTNIYQPQGGDQYGDLNRDRTFAEQSRANELEGAERTRFSVTA